MLLQHRMAAVPPSEHEEPTLELEPQPSTRMCRAHVAESCVERRRPTSHAAPHRRLDEYGLVDRLVPMRMHT